MTIILIILAIVFGWILLGCIVLSSIDKDNLLFNWVFNEPQRSPGLFSIFALLFWPLVAYRFLTNKGVNND